MADEKKSLSLEKSREMLASRLERDARNAAIWRFSFLLVLFVAVGACLGLAWFAFQSNIRVYVVEMKDERIVRMLPLEARKDAGQTFEKAVAKQFIENLRTVVSDGEAQRLFVDRVYSLLRADGEAYSVINTWYRENNPFELGENIRVRVEVTSINALSKSSYQVEWREYVDPGNGEEEISRWKSIITFEYGTISTEEEVLANPFGVFVSGFSASQELR